MQEVIFLIFSLENIYLAIWIIFVTSILLSKKHPITTMSWLLTITLIPVIGMLLYIFLGINWREVTLINKIKNTTHHSVRSIMISNLVKFNSSDFFGRGKRDKLDEILKNLKLEDETVEIINLIFNTEKTQPNLNQNYEIYYSGKNAFKALKNDLLNAKDSIYMEYYIWRSDELGVRVKEILIAKAKEGVEIKLIFDGLGSFLSIDRVYKKELEKAGVEFLYFLDIKLFMLKLDYRNHRKMTIIDGKILHTGGMNLGLEYITGGDKFDSWRDTNIRVIGDMALYYMAIFATDWLNSGGKFDFNRFEKFILNRSNSINSHPMQVSSSGPDSQWASIKYLYTKCITNAKREIFIQTPYFIPDHSLLEQLKIAALSGVKVRIMSAGKSDNIITHRVGKTFFEELLLANIEVYQYQKGFLHAKTILYDDEVSSIGTCNFDSRSFNINYEINAIFYDKEINSKLKKQFFEDMKYSTKLELDFFIKQSKFKRLTDSFFRLFAPLL
ncbi:cardiolipin synthase [Campylobacter corcagiensis]|uniref:Cardiolipin synthase n=1 Tax=Campylobacter corcagiensis TaxID=1448857 RepID=A0A7M1LJH1_9BACT|nr:cardiolipin synthase [Campylobacter corcagiensis]QKF65359.1 cardiolipin synthase family protein [Campylobacter corcagiensis]QOQ88064.1 cardiolipin synthase [Campylobacter corcagiensis]